MYNIRRAEKSDLDEIIDLVNKVFRAPDMPLSMGKQFPLLFSEENVDNLYLAENEEGKIISHNGIKKHNIMIYGHQLSFASMGAVCTDPDYQGQGIATKILNNIFENLKRENISLLTISGARSLYTRQGAVLTSGKKEYLIDKTLEVNHNRNIKYYFDRNKVPEHINEITKIYHKEPVRYQRKRWEFPLLIEAMPAVHDVPYPPDYAVLSMAKDQEIQAYIIGYFKDEQFKIIEYSGERSAVFKGLSYLQLENNISEILIDIPLYDKILIDYLESVELQSKKSTYGATYKIMNEENFIKEIIPIIKEKAGSKILDIKKDITVDISDNEELLHFIFDDYSRDDYVNNWNEVLPLPLPYPGCLNYI
ncbi:MAG: GNAT family N-acetyltransferase [Bacillota bacterium]